MKVSRLIKLLQEQDPNATVVTEFAPGSGNFGRLDSGVEVGKWDPRRNGFYSGDDLGDAPRGSRKAIVICVKED